MSDDNLPEPKKPHPVPALFEHLGIKHVRPSDRFTITYRDGLLEAHVRRSSGQTETLVKHVKGNGFQQMTAFDPDQMSKDERNELIRTLYDRNHTQGELANMFGLSQAMISRIVGA